MVTERMKLKDVLCAEKNSEKNNSGHQAGSELCLDSLSPASVSVCERLRVTMVAKR